MAKIVIGKKLKDSIVHATFGNKIVLKNDDGKIVSVLYVLPDGNLDQDSWIHDVRKTKAEDDEIGGNE